MVSVIVPIYNVGSEIEACLNSLAAQDYSHYEVILVNDGSSDNSAETCAKYCQKSELFRYIEQSNQGVAAARQVGVEASKGEFVIFVDADDSLPQGAISTLVQSIENEDSIDIVCSGYRVHTFKKNYSKRLTPLTLSQDEWIKALLLDEVSHEPWAKIFRRRLFNKESFPRLKRGQDWLSNIEVASRVNRVRMINELCYNYNHRTSSTMRTHSYNLLSDKELCDKVKAILQQSNIYEKYRDEHSRMSLNQIFITLAKGTRVNLSNKWVDEVYTSTTHLKLTLREQIARAAIKWQLFQLLLQSIARIYRKF
ncbi:MAG: glycosyltransferase [Rikenellaceae bacterium]